MEQYLASSNYIDWKTDIVAMKARELAMPCINNLEIARACFEFVRDEIKHSGDFKLDPVTCKASDVLKHGTGYCYAKSHLLAALLRANAIPAGLSYQRLTIENDTPPFSLHGLNSIYLEPWGWYRVDARGNKDGVAAEFNPPTEKLAFSIIRKGEADIEEIYSEPIEVVVNVLQNSNNYLEVMNNLPDMDLPTL